MLGRILEQRHSAVLIPGTGLSNFSNISCPRFRIQFGCSKAASNTSMQARARNQAGAGRPRAAGLLVQVGMILLALLGFVLLPAVFGPFERSWPVWLVAAVMYVGILCFAMKLCHPLRSRIDQTQSWREKFPTHDEQEVQRFLEYVTRQTGARGAPPAPKRAEHAK